MPASANPTTRGAEVAAETASAAGTATRASGLKPWLPLIANLVLMPVLAYLTVALFILPKLHAGSAHASGTTGAANGKEPAAHEKLMVTLSSKIIVNVAGTMGSRYLLANLTLVGTSADFKVLVEKNDAQLRDAAAGALSVKTIADLEKPGARNLIRTELISIFNNVLGNNSVADIYLTEFAIQ